GVRRGIFVQAEHERVVEKPEVEEVARARKPRDDGAPAEPQERTRRDLLADTGATAPALIGGRRRERGDLNEVEIIEQADPGDARDDVNPDQKARRLEDDERKPGEQVGYDRDDDGEHDTRDDCALDGVQRVHSNLRSGVTAPVIVACSNGITVWRYTVILPQRNYGTCSGARSLEE